MIGRRSRGRRRRRHGAREDTIPPIRLLIYADVVGKPTEEVEFGFDPTQDLVRRGQDFEIAESDFGWLVGVVSVILREGRRGS